MAERAFLLTIPLLDLVCIGWRLIIGTERTTVRLFGWKSGSTWMWDCVAVVDFGDVDKNSKALDEVVGIGMVFNNSGAKVGTVKDSGTLVGSLKDSEALGVDGFDDTNDNEWSVCDNDSDEDDWGCETTILVFVTRGITGVGVCYDTDGDIAGLKTKVM